MLAARSDKMKFLVIGTKTGVEVYAWAQRPYSKFMAFKVTNFLLLILILLCIVFSWFTKQTYTGRYGAYVWG